MYILRHVFYVGRYKSFRTECLAAELVAGVLLNERYLIDSRFHSNYLSVGERTLGVCILLKTGI